MKTYFFDMDGTFVDLYGVDNWLDDLINEKTRPYDEAKPLVNLARLAKAMNKARRNGNKVCIVSWLAKNATDSMMKSLIEIIGQAKPTNHQKSLKSSDKGLLFFYKKFFKKLLTTIIKMWYNETENPSNPAAAPARKIIPHLNTFCQEIF